jgi:hypothetical protein
MFGPFHCQDQGQRGTPTTGIFVVVLNYEQTTSLTIKLSMAIAVKTNKALLIEDIPGGIEPNNLLRPLNNYESFRNPAYYSFFLLLPFFLFISVRIHVGCLPYLHL